MIQRATPNSWQDAGTVEIRTKDLPGSFAVGLRHYHAIDPARIDAQDETHRQFMVSAFYPAQRSEGNSAARLVDIFEPEVPRALAYLTEGLESGMRDELIARLRSIGLQAIREGAPERSDVPCPVLIYYPAGESNRFANVDVCEGLASYGFVVLAVDGPHDSPLVVFPDGRFCTGPLEGDYISPGVGDVSFLISQLEDLNGEEGLRGMIDAQRVGVFGHSRGGYIANVSAFMSDRVNAAASIDSFLWGSPAGLEAFPPDFRAKVKSTAKPLLRLCGRPADSDPKTEAEFCLDRDGGDFVGDFSVVSFPGWAHGDFRTTPWLCGRGRDLIANQKQVRAGAAETLTEILKCFFDINLRGVNPIWLKECLQQYPALGMAMKYAKQLNSPH